jgi:hypothetical protein
MLPRKLSYAAKCALLSQQECLGQDVASVGAFLGSSYEEDVLDALRDLYGKNVVQNIGLPEKTILEAIGKAAYNYRMGYYTRAVAAEKSLRDVIAKGMKLETDAQKFSVLKLLKLMEGINYNNYPVLATYLSTQKVTASTKIDAAKVAATNAAASLKEGIKDTIKESIAAGANLLKEGANAANEVLPWYLNLKVIVPVGLLAFATIYALPLLSAIPKPKWKKNPVDPREAEAAKVYRTFHDFAPRKKKYLKKIDTSHLVQLGQAKAVGYRSNKWTGKYENYMHDHGKSVKLYWAPASSALVIMGGKLDVTDRGIVG